jgi:glycerol uptake facilitator protein
MSRVIVYGRIHMEYFVAEMFGTMLLLILGNGAVANVLLSDSKGKDSGWIVITTGWAFAVAVSVYVTGWASGAHINPAVTLGLYSVGDLSGDLVFYYLGGQFLGAFLGAVLVWLQYLPHWSKTEDQDAKLAVFCTAPAIRHTGAKENNLSDGLAPLLVGILVWSIGLSLGGSTGYAINPARDLAPRIAHFLLPIENKRDSDWSYSWIPVVAPISGAVVGAMLYKWVFSLMKVV